MTSILALDPAWTPRQASGVALLVERDAKWSCMAVAPSYDQFYDLAEWRTVRWDETPRGSPPDAARLLDAATRMLGGADVDLVTLDMPIATVPVQGRRECDNAVSRAFGARGCSTHSPSVSRPGPLGHELTRQFNALGFVVATTATPPGTTGVIAEVYPHPALLSLLNETYRVKYKISHATSYWRDEVTTSAQRRHRVVDQLRRIYDELATSISPIDIWLPSSDEVETMTASKIKRYEDALDAVICGWVGMEYLARRCVAYGDDTAAIWIPAMRG